MVYIGFTLLPGTLVEYEAQPMGLNLICTSTESHYTYQLTVRFAGYARNRYIRAYIVGFLSMNGIY